MVAYSFKARFETPIMEGTKLQTIRAVGKRRHARPGEELQLYRAMRTKSCRLMKRETCRWTSPIVIDFDTWSVETSQWSIGPALVPGRPLNRKALAQLDTFAQDDGFSGWQELIAFWSVEHFKKKTPRGRFRGVIVKW